MTTSELKEKKKKPKDYIYETKLASGKTSYWFQVMVDGVRQTRRGFSTKGEAKKARAEIMTELSKGNRISPSKTPFGKYFEDWLATRSKAKKSLSISTQKMYDSYYRIHIASVIGSIPLSKISPDDIDALVNAVQKKGLSEEMVKRVYSVVHTALNAAVKKGTILTNPANRIEKPRVNRQERQVWSDETVKEFLKASRGYSRYWIAVYLAVMTGMRQGEILGLKWSDIDFDNGVIQVIRNYNKNSKTFDDLKTLKSRRAIAISPQIVEMLKEQKEKFEIEKNALGDRYHNYDLVIPASNGKPAFTNLVNRAWHAMRDKFKPEGAAEITFHDLRHTFASILLKQGEHPKIVSEILGHSTISITMDRYSHLLPGLQGEAMRKMGTMMDIEDVT